MELLNIGVLGFQGSVEEHLTSLSRIAKDSPIRALSVKKVDELKSVDGLILPGGESTTLGKLLNMYFLMEPLKEAAKAGMPIWGTCAGAILLAKRIIDSPIVHIGAMDIEVARNAYGTQVNSFVTSIEIPSVSMSEIPLVFVRAPIIKSVGTRANVLAVISGNIVAARDGNLLATTFHPELTDDLSFHEYFVDIVKKAKLEKFIEKQEGSNMNE